MDYNENASVNKKVIHTDFCDVHISINKKTKEPDSAFITISYEQEKWMATHPDIAFFPDYFFNAFNEAKTNKYGEKVIFLCKSVPLSSNSYNGYDNTKTFPAWNFQLAGDYKSKMDTCAKTINDAHFLKIFHDNNGNCNTIQAGSFNSKIGRDLNVGYIKKVETLEDQLSNKYQAGFFTDKVEKMEAYKAERGSYNSTVVEAQKGSSIKAYNGKLLYYDIPIKTDSKYNAALCNSVSYLNGEFNCYFKKVSDTDIQDSSKFKEKNITNTNNITNNDEDGTPNNNIKNPSITDVNGIEYKKVAKIDNDHYIVVESGNELNPKYMEAELKQIGFPPNNVYKCKVKDIDDNKPIAVNKNDIIQPINYKGNFNGMDKITYKKIGNPAVDNGINTHSDDPGNKAVSFYYSRQRIDCTITNTLDNKNATINDISSNKANIISIFNFDNQKEVDKNDIDKEINSSSPNINLEALDNLLFI